MGRDSIVDDAERTRQQTTDESEEETDSTDNSEAGDDRKRITQRIPRDLLADVDAVQEQYALPSRNATINFMLKQEINDLLDGGE